MKYYKRASNSGPVPYPDGSGRMLTDEVVSGDEWEQFIALEYVIHTTKPKAITEPKAIVEPVITVKTDKTEKSVVKGSKAANSKNLPVNQSDNLVMDSAIIEIKKSKNGPAAQRNGTDRVDQEATRSTDVEGAPVAGSAAGRTIGG